MANTPTKQKQESTALQTGSKTTVETIKSMIKDRGSMILSLLPNQTDIDKVVSRYALQFIKTPKLLECTKESLIMTIYAGASTGLNPDPQMQEFYMIPFKNGQGGFLQCQFIIGYRGLMKLIRNEPSVTYLDAQGIYENDTFKHVQGSSNHIEHHWKIGTPRGKFIGAYAICKVQNGQQYVRVMDKEEIDKIKATSKSKNFWDAHYDQMAIKTVVRRLAKNLPMELTNQTRQALAADDAVESGKTITVDPASGAIIDMPVEHEEEAPQAPKKSQSRLDNFALQQGTAPPPASIQTLEVESEPIQEAITEQEAKAMVPQPQKQVTPPVVTPSTPQVVEEAPQVVGKPAITGEVLTCSECGEDVALATQKYNLKAGIPIDTCLVHQADYEH